MRIFADEGELVEKYRRLSDEGRARISSQIECELHIDAEVAAKRQESQRKGIESREEGWHTLRPSTDELSSELGRGLCAVEGTGYNGR